MLQRVVLETVRGGREKFFYWLGNRCDVRVGQCTELVLICNDSVTGHMRRRGEHCVWVWGRKDVCFTGVIKLE